MIGPLLSLASHLYLFAAILYLAYFEKAHVFGGIEAPKQLRLAPISRSGPETRLNWFDGKPDAGLLAAAGLQRLGLEERITALLEPEVMLPTVGQGALAIETRGDCAQRIHRVASLEDATMRLAVGCERAFLARLDGGCQVPIADYARISGEELDLRSLVGYPDGRIIVRFERARFHLVRGRREPRQAGCRGCART